MDEQIHIINDQGNEATVGRKAFTVVYQPQGWREVEALRQAASGPAADDVTPDRAPKRRSRKSE